MDMKNKVSSLILDRLRKYLRMLYHQILFNYVTEEAAKPYIVNKMNYESFDSAITSKLGLIVMNWPLPVFQAPGKFNSMAELRTLYYAWNSGHAHFLRLSPDELARYQEVTRDRPLPTDTAEVTQASTSDTADPARTYEGAFSATDAPERPAKKPRKDKGTKRGPNARTKSRAE